MAGGGTLRRLVLNLGRGRQLEPRMHVLTLRPVGTEAGQIVVAQDAPHMPVPAVGPMPAEPPIVPGAIFDFALRIDVQKRALLVVAGVEAGVEVAFRHLGHVVLVQKLALVALFAQTAQPVLAHDRAIAADVSERAGVALLAFRPVGGVEKQTHGRGGF